MPDDDFAAFWKTLEIDDVRANKHREELEANGKWFYAEPIKTIEEGLQELKKIKTTEEGLQDVKKHSVIGAHRFFTTPTKSHEEDLPKKNATFKKT